MGDGLCDVGDFVVGVELYDVGVFVGVGVVYEYGGVDDFVCGNGWCVCEIFVCEGCVVEVEVEWLDWCGVDVCDVGVFVECGV